MTREDIPPLVSRALRASLEAGFVDTTRTETGELLACLAARAVGPIADIGTGGGVGAAWLRSAAPASVPVFTVDSDAALARRATATFDDEAVTVLHGDWRTLTATGPFDLVSVDADVAQHDTEDVLVTLLAPGALAVIDDLRPVGLCAGHDALRTRWRHDPRVVSVDLPIGADAGLLLATRPRDAHISDS